MAKTRESLSWVVEYANRQVELAQKMIRDAAPDDCEPQQLAEAIGALGNASDYLQELAIRLNADDWVPDDGSGIKTDRQLELERWNAEAVAANAAAHQRYRLEFDLDADAPGAADHQCVADTAKNAARSIGEEVEVAYERHGPAGGNPMVVLTGYRSGLTMAFAAVRGLIADNEPYEGASLDPRNWSAEDREDWESMTPVDDLREWNEAGFAAGDSNGAPPARLPVLQLELSVQSGVGRARWYDAAFDESRVVFELNTGWFSSPSPTLLGVARACYAALSDRFEIEFWHDGRCEWVGAAEWMDGCFEQAVPGDDRIHGTVQSVQYEGGYCRLVIEWDRPGLNPNWNAEPDWADPRVGDRAWAHHDDQFAFKS